MPPQRKILRMSEHEILPNKPDVVDIPRQEIARPAGHLTVNRTEYGFSGPIPAPELLAKYNSALPGAADRIISMAEGEASHCRTIEAMLVDK
jgi:hypothetical protein